MLPLWKLTAESSAIRRFPLCDDLCGDLRPSVDTYSLSLDFGSASGFTTVAIESDVPGFSCSESFCNLKLKQNDYFYITCFFLRKLGVSTMYTLSNLQLAFRKLAILRIRHFETRMPISIYSIYVVAILRLSP